MWRSSSSDKNFYVVSRQFSPAKSFVYLWSLYNSLYCILHRHSRSGYIGAQPIGYSLVKLCQILCITFSYLLNTWQSSSARTSSAYSTDFRVHFISHSSSIMFMMTQFLVFKRQMILFHSPYLNVEIVELWLSVFVCFVRLVSCYCSVINYVSIRYLVSGFIFRWWRVYWFISSISITA